MDHNTEHIFDARDTEAIRLLKTDPDSYFRKTHKQPFGFAVNSEKSVDRTNMK